MQRIIARLIGPQRDDRDNVIAYLAHRTQILPRHMIDGMALLAISRVVDREDALGRGGGFRIQTQQPQTPVGMKLPDRIRPH